MAPQTSPASSGTDRPGHATRRPPVDAVRFAWLVAIVTGVARLALAGEQSYWLDELYSVYVYTVQPDGLIAAIRALGETSIHPPLYQTLLYGWIETFGPSEAATRGLSNLAVTLAIVAFHRLVWRLHGTTTANLATVAFAVSWAVTHYGMETRSYGLSLLLATLASLTLVRYLQDRPGPAATARTDGTWRTHLWLAAPWAAANLALALTHYYNLFTLAAQGLLLLGWAVATAPAGARLREAALVAAAGLVQLVAAYAIWGRVTLAALERYADEYGVADAGPDETPWAMFVAVAGDETRLPAAGLAVLAVAVTVGLVLAARRHGHLLGAVHHLTLVVGPLLVAYLAFATLGQERFAARYLVTIVPALLAGVVVGVRALSTLAARRRPALATPLAAVAVLALVLPGTVAALTYDKDPWRETAAEVVDLLADTEGEVAVVETAWRDEPVLDFHLGRTADDAGLEPPPAVDVTLRRTHEASASFPTLEQLDDVDTLIVVFTHHRIGDFPAAAAWLDQRRERATQQLDPDGRGLVVWTR